MRLPIDDPQLADDFAPREEAMPYTVEGYRKEIQSLNRKLARVYNMIRLASTLSSEPKIKTILEDALDNRN